MPFVQEWKLPVNPEDIEEMVWAVLHHANSDYPLDRIVEAVGEQLAEYEATDKRLTQAQSGVEREQRDATEAG